MLVVFSEVPRDADQARAGPIDLTGLGLAQLLEHKPLEILPMSHKPIEVEEALVDHVFVGGSLILDDDRRIVFVDTQGVHPATLVRDKFGGKEPHTKQCLEVRFEECLERLLQQHLTAG